MFILLLTAATSYAESAWKYRVQEDKMSGKKLIMFKVSLKIHSQDG